MNYEIIMAGKHSSLVKTQNSVNNETVFATLKEAKSGLNKYFDTLINDIKGMKRTVSSLKEQHIN